MSEHLTTAKAALARAQTFAPDSDERKQAMSEYEGAMSLHKAATELAKATEPSAEDLAAKQAEEKKLNDRFEALEAEMKKINERPSILSNIADMSVQDTKRQEMQEVLIKGAMAKEAGSVEIKFTEADFDVVSTGTGANGGGNVIKPVVSQEIINIRPRANVFRTLGIPTFSTEGTQDVIVPVLDGTKTRPAMPAEGAAANGYNDSNNAITISSKRYAFSEGWTNAYLASAPTGIVSEITNYLVRGMEQEFTEDITKSLFGSGATVGLAADLAGITNTASFTLGKVRELLYGTDDAFDDTIAIMMKKASYPTILDLGENVLVPRGADALFGSRPSLMMQPVYWNRYMDAEFSGGAGAAQKRPMGVIAPEAFRIRDTSIMIITVDPYTKANEGKIVYTVESWHGFGGLNSRSANAAVSSSVVTFNA